LLTAEEQSVLLVYSVSGKGGCHVPVQKEVFYEELIRCSDRAALEINRSPSLDREAINALCIVVLPPKCKIAAANSPAFRGRSVGCTARMRYKFPAGDSTDPRPTMGDSRFAGSSRMSVPVLSPTKPVFPTQMGSPGGAENKNRTESESVAVTDVAA